MQTSRRISAAVVAIAVFTTVAGALAQSMSFSQASYAVLGEPRAIVTADFNHDGRLDLAVASFNAGSATAGAITIFGNKGDGSFTAQRVLQTTAGPFAMVAGDFDNDGDADLAVVNADAQVVNVQLHQKGTAFGFSSPGNYVKNAAPRGITTADFNRDGRLDLAITSVACNCVDIALGNGNGTFLSHFTAAVASGPLAIAAADLDHDGLLDLVTAGSNSITLLFGNGGGTFGARRDVNLGVALQSLTLAQINRNDRFDFIGVGRDFFVESWDLNRGGGNLLGFDSTGGTDTRGLGIVDINGDGIPDVIVANRDNSRVTVWLASTAINTCGDECAPGFSLGATLQARSGARAIAIGDFNVDGRPDIATADQSGHSMTVFLNTTPFAGRP